MALAYHYTTLLHLPFILASGWLDPSRREAHGDHFGGLLWFSSNETLERSALKADVPTLRFAYGRANLAPWRVAAGRVGFTAGQMRRLEKNGRAMGACPSEWYALVGGLSLALIERLELRWRGQWREVHPAGLEVERVRDQAVMLKTPAGIAITSARFIAADGVTVGYRAASSEMNAGALLYGADNEGVALASQALVS
ncbi:hypothetical protein V6O07_19835 [Arthrospira platensis SPKY2]